MSMWLFLHEATFQAQKPTSVKHIIQKLTGNYETKPQQATKPKTKKTKPSLSRTLNLLPFLTSLIQPKCSEKQKAIEVSQKWNIRKMCTLYLPHAHS